MKYIFSLVLAIVLLTSCATVSEQAQKEHFTSADDINLWVNCYIKWENVPDSSDTVSPASVTLARGKGSCYDQAVVFLYLAKKAGINAKLYPIVGDDIGYHMCVFCDDDGYIYDPTNYRKYYLLPDGWREYTKPL